MKDFPINNYQRIKPRILLVVALCFSLFASINLWADPTPPVISNQEVKALFSEKKYMQAILKASELGEANDKNAITRWVEIRLETFSENESGVIVLKKPGGVQLGRVVQTANITFLEKEEGIDPDSIGDLESGFEDALEFVSSKHEVASYELSKVLGFDIVPPTREVSGKIRQLWVEDSKVSLKDNPLETGVFDYLAFQHDRNTDNSLVLDSGEILAIDNGASFFSSGDIEKLMELQPENDPAAILFNSSDSDFKKKFQLAFNTREKFDRFISIKEDQWRAFFKEHVGGTLAEEDAFIDRTTTINTSMTDLLEKDQFFFATAKLEYGIQKSQRKTVYPMIMEPPPLAPCD
ncbi:MAG: hypothetical protein ACR2PT_12480 [Endozoicomonas sp.]